MAKYRLTKPAFLAVNGSPRKQIFRAGGIVDVADDFIPAAAMFPLNEAAVAAVEKRNARQPFEIARNGVQAINRRTGRTLVTPASDPLGPPR